LTKEWLTKLGYFYELKLLRKLQKFARNEGEERRNVTQVKESAWEASKVLHAA
jgi:hypothetical protein